MTMRRRRRWPSAARCRSYAHQLVPLFPSVVPLFPSVYSRRAQHLTLSLLTARADPGAGRHHGRVRRCRVGGRLLPVLPGLGRDQRYLFCRRRLPGRESRQHKRGRTFLCSGSGSGSGSGLTIALAWCAAGERQGSRDRQPDHRRHPDHLRRPRRCARPPRLPAASHTTEN